MQISRQITAEAFSLLGYKKLELEINSNWSRFYSGTGPRTVIFHPEYDNLGFWLFHRVGSGLQNKGIRYLKERLTDAKVLDKIKCITVPDSFDARSLKDFKGLELIFYIIDGQDWDVKRGEGFGLQSASVDGRRTPIHNRTGYKDRVFRYNIKQFRRETQLYLSGETKRSVPQVEFVDKLYRHKA